VRKLGRKRRKLIEAKNKQKKIGKSFWNEKNLFKKCEKFLRIYLIFFFDII
jgi:hypothetical protein